MPPGSGLVEIDLIDRDGGTLLRMTHSGLPNPAQCAGHAKGWAHYLERLAMAADGRIPALIVASVPRDAWRDTPRVNCASCAHRLLSYGGLPVAAARSARRRSTWPCQCRRSGLARHY